MKQKKSKENIFIGIFLGVVGLVVLFALISTVSLFVSEKNSELKSNSVDKVVPMKQRMSLTPYDKELAKKMMDKNNDGKCDACGMPVEMCIDTGMMQCSGMDPEATIGILQSQHVHADWKVYINGKALGFEGKDHMSRMKANLPISSFIHVDAGAPAPENTGDILHMHATGVPLWIFFESISLKLPNGIKVYVNGKEISDYKDYVFNDLDKILITDGNGGLKEQLDSITSFAEKH